MANEWVGEAGLGRTRFRPLQLVLPQATVFSLVEVLMRGGDKDELALLGDG